MSQDLIAPPRGLSPQTDQELDRMFRSARTHRVWTDAPVSVETLKSIYETMKFGPTSANTSPFRTLFLTTPEAKERLIPAMAEGNREKTRTAPAVAIFAMDLEFYELMGKLMPGSHMRSVFADDSALAMRTAAQSSTLQAAYFMVVARAFGLDCGPMGGFDADKVNAEFFSDGSWRVNFICNLGHGDPSALSPRLPRLEFEEVCRIL